MARLLLWPPSAMGGGRGRGRRGRGGGGADLAAVWWIRLAQEQRGSVRFIHSGVMVGVVCGVLHW